MSATIIDKTAEALKRITGITDRNLHDLTEDTAKMTRAMMGDAFKTASEGTLANSVGANHEGELKHTVTTDADNKDGVGYGAKQEWGWHDRAGVKHKGRHIILRASWGMRKRYARGEKWRD